MNLYIAEKPSLGRAIAEALPKPLKREEGFIRAANGDCVSWCIGHLLEQAEPEVYDPQFKKWDLSHLPIVPQQWQLRPKTKTRKQLSVLKKLVKQADHLIHAGDPDREGQLLVDQLIDYLEVTGEKRANIQRCLINDLNLSAVNRALQQLRDNREFIALSTSALTRARADWLYGINMTRAYTLQGQKVGYQGVLSVGRVQTPLLGLVVRRDLEIEHFISKPFYEVLALFQTQQGDTFTAKWQPSEACLPYQDEEGRVLSKELALNVIERIREKTANVKSVQKKQKFAAPPLPYNLSALQIDAAKRYGLSAQKVLDTCQRLYEQHKLITYPRSDCRYLPKEHLVHVNKVISAISNNCKLLANAGSKANASLKSKAWNDNKVDAHHAIIPTIKKHNPQALSKQEQQIYELIARQYICQFYPKHEYCEQQIDVIVAGGLFTAKAKQTLALGWKELFNSDEKTQDQTKQQLKLPTLNKGDSLHCNCGELVEKQTQPPKPFTDATMLAAMTGINRFVTNPQLRKILKDTDGIGTEATRAGIIELLFKRNFLLRKGRQIHATETGKALVVSLPEVATTPDMTAQWETELSAISNRESTYKAFMLPMEKALESLIERSKAELPVQLRGIKAKKTTPRKKRFNAKSKKGAKRTQQAR